MLLALKKDYLMKKLLVVTFIILLTGCFGPAKFDASNETATKESTQKIVDGLSEEPPFPENHLTLQQRLSYLLI